MTSGGYVNSHQGYATVGISSLMYQQIFKKCFIVEFWIQQFGLSQVFNLLLTINK